MGTLCKCLMLVVMLVPTLAYAQSDAQKEYEMQKVAERQRLIAQQLDSAIMLTDRAEYEAADQKYLRILKTIKSVPSDLTFHFGKNSFFLKKYKQSIDWLNKYIQLKGTSGQYYDEAVQWKLKAEAGLLNEKKEQFVQATQVLSQDYSIDCGPTGKVICPVCNGSTVIIKKDYLGNTYKTCPYCDKHGFLSCENYNKLLKGELKPSK